MRTERRLLRVVLDGPPSIEQLRALRFVQPRLAELPPQELQRYLGRRRIWVIADLCVDDFDRTRAELERVGIHAELTSFADYTPEYLRRVLPPAPPEWDRSEQRLEVVFRPSFSPEVILRLFRDGSRCTLQLASMSTSVWERHFNAPEWLEIRRKVVMRSSSPRPSASPAAPIDAEPEEPLEQAIEETVLVDADDELFAAAHAVPALDAGFGLDGMFVTMTSRRGSETVSRECWSPSTARCPALHRVLTRLDRLAWGGLSTPASRACLEELRG